MKTGPYRVLDALGSLKQTHLKPLPMITPSNHVGHFMTTVQTSVLVYDTRPPSSLPFLADDREPKSIVSVCLSRKRFVGIIIIMLIIVVALVVVLALLAALPQDIHTSTEVYNVNNDTVLAVQFDRHKYNAVTLKHIRRNIVPTHTVYVYSQNCETLTVYNQTVLRTSNHSINISQHTLVSDPTYLLPGSKMEFNVTLLNVPSITAEIYLYIFNDLDILFTYYYEQNLGKNAYKSKVYTHGSGSQSTTTSIQYNVTDKGYWFAAIVSDTLFEMEYSSRFYEVLYNRSKLPEKCVLQDTDSCQVDYSFTSASQKECVLCYVTAPPVTSPDPAHITTTVTRKGETPSFYGVLAILIFFCILSFVIISITCICSFVPASKGKYSPLP